MFTLDQIQHWLPTAKIIGAADTQITGISTDSRTVKPGDLFIALQGERFDAHTFLPQVQQRGAAAALVSDATACDLPYIQVANTRTALCELAAKWRSRFDLPLVLVLGSNGKTTVKEMIAAIFCQAVGPSHYLATVGNYNNDIGLPLSLLKLNSQHQLAVIELGMNHPGETAMLAQIAQPTVVLINNAQREHQEFMHTVEAVAQEHAAAIDSLAPEGIAVFPADSPYQSLWRERAQPRQIIDFALEGPAAVKGQAISITQSHSHIDIKTAQEEISVRLATLGTHNLHNALAACAACCAVKINPHTIKLGLESFVPAKGRLQITPGPVLTVIDDSYNANPDSVRAAIDVLAQMPGPLTLVLGDMGDVGLHGRDFHIEVGKYAKAKKINLLIGVGPLSQHSCDAFGHDSQSFSDAQALCQQLQTGNIAIHGTVLVKGSRFMRMEQVIPLLNHNPSQQPSADTKEGLCS